MKAIAAIVGVVALSAPIMVNGQENLSLGFTTGIGSINLSGIESGIVDAGGEHTFSASGLGPHLGFSGGASLGSMGSYDLSLGWSGFGTMAHGGSSMTETFTGPGVVSISGVTTPGNASIALTTNSAGGNASGSAAVTNTNPEGGNSFTNVVAAPGPGQQNIAAVTGSGTGTSFTYGGLVTDGAGNSSAAYGAVGASDGGIFIGAGDLTGLAITTQSSYDVFYSGADLSLAVGGVVSERMAAQAYAGPSYRLLGQHAETTVSVDIPETPASTVVFPTYSMATNLDVDSHYLGGVIGVNASYVLSNQLILSFGGEAGVYHAVDFLRGTESYSASGGSNGGVPMPEQSATANAFSAESNGLAWSARGNGLLTVLLAPNRQLSFGGSAEYLSRVATADRQASAVTTTGYAPGSDDGSVNYTAGAAGTPIITFGDMWSFTGSVSLTGQF